MKTYYYDIFATSVGDFAAALDAEGNLVATAFGGEGDLRGRVDAGGDVWVRDAGRLRAVRLQVGEYFAGKRRVFDLPLRPEGTAYQQRVWAALCAIPYGETCSYGDLARALGSSPRAVGRANGTNPIALIVPCHRVIGASGALTGFAFGVETKRKLLEHEGARLPVLGMELPLG